MRSSFPCAALVIVLLLCAPPAARSQIAAAPSSAEAAGGASRRGLPDLGGAALITAAGAQPPHLLRRLWHIPRRASAAPSAVLLGGQVGASWRPPGHSGARSAAEGVAKAIGRAANVEDPEPDAQLTAFWRGDPCGSNEATLEHNAAWCNGRNRPLRCNESVRVPSSVCPGGRASLRSVAGDGTPAGKAIVGGCSYLFFSRYRCDGGDTIAQAAMRSAEPTFTDLDCLERDGEVTEDEAATWSVKNGVPYSEVQELFVLFDVDGSLTLSEEEFARGQPLSSRLLAGLGASFESVDRDGNGSISRHEWLSYCSGWMTPRPEPAACAQLFDDVVAESPKGELSRKQFEACGGKGAREELL